MPRKYTKEMRIRYAEKRNYPKHILESVRTYTSATTGAKYKVRLNCETTTFQVINMGQRKIVKTGGKPGITDYWLKKIAKKALESLGVNFNMELRHNKPLPQNSNSEPEKDDSDK